MGKQCDEGAEEAVFGGGMGGRGSRMRRTGAGQREEEAVCWGERGRSNLVCDVGVRRSR